MIDEIRAALDPVADAFEALGVSYRVGGSVASSAPRMADQRFRVSRNARMRSTVARSRAAVLSSMDR